MSLSGVTKTEEPAVARFFTLPFSFFRTGEFFFVFCFFTIIPRFDPTIPLSPLFLLRFLFSREVPSGEDDPALSFLARASPPSRLSELSCRILRVLIVSRASQIGDALMTRRVGKKETRVRERAPARKRMISEIDGEGRLLGYYATPSREGWKH